MTSKASKTKLDMGHGFMKSIIKNQVARDQYDKDVKAVQSTTTTRAVVKSHMDDRQRHRKPEMPKYSAPTQRKDPAEWNAPRELLFRLEYEDQSGKVYHIPVHKEDDPVIVSRRFGHDHGLANPMIMALTEVLQEEMDKMQAS